MVATQQRAFDRSRFPLGDGDPMPEVTDHLEQLIELRLSLQALLEGTPTVYVGGNHFVYYDIDDPSHNVCPDLYVAFDVAHRQRQAFLAFEEGVFPQLVIEIISKSTRKEDLGSKVHLYAQLGVQEYYVCDPRSDVRPRSRLYAYVLTDQVLAPRVIAEHGSIFSPLLDTELRLFDRVLRVLDPRTGVPILNPEELRVRLAEEQQARHAMAVRLADEERARSELAMRLGDAEERVRQAEAALREALARLERPDARQ